MDIPLSVLAETITESCICQFRNIAHVHSKSPHYHVIITTKNKDSIVICHITKQIENKIWYYHRANNEKAITCLVRVDTTDLDFLTEESIIECNQAEIILKQEFANIVHPSHGCQLIAPTISTDLENKIKEAILSSPLVKPFIKNAL
jgi:hypothetical protein